MDCRLDAGAGSGTAGAAAGAGATEAGTVVGVKERAMGALRLANNCCEEGAEGPRDPKPVYGEALPEGGPLKLPNDMVVYKISMVVV